MELARGIKPGSELADVSMDVVDTREVWRRRMGVLRGALEITRKHLFCTTWRS
jgi:hypothetical protein